MKLSELKNKIEQSLNATTTSIREKFSKKEEALELEAQQAENQIEIVNRYKLLISRAEGHANTFNQIRERFARYDEEVFYDSIVKNFDGYPPMEHPQRFNDVTAQMMRLESIHRHSEKIIAAARARYIDAPMKELETYAKTHALTLKAFGIET